MHKSLKLDTSIYPFVPCHEHCENNCEADACSKRCVDKCYKKLGIHCDRKKVFVRLLTHINNVTHSFINLKERDLEVDKCLKLLRVYVAADVTRLFRHFSLTKDSLLNTCACCSSTRGRVLHVQLRNIFKTCAYCYYTFETLHGCELCLETRPTKPSFALRGWFSGELGVLSLPAERRHFYITVTSKKYLSFVKNTL